MALVKSTDENYKELIGTKGKLTLIKFTADWCGPCKAINPILETISEKMADSIELQFISSKTHKRKVNVVPLWVDTQKFRPLSRQDNEFVKTHNLENKFIVLYSGNMGISHDFAGLLEAAKLLKNELNVVFVFIGDGAKKNEIVRYISDNQLNNTLTLPFQSEQILPQSLSMADLSVVSLESSLDANILPSKVIYSMAIE